MPCLFCDAPVPAGARYCPNCGTSLDTLGRGAPGDPAVLWKQGGSDRAEGGSPFTTQPVRTSSTAILSLACGIAAWTLLPILGAIFAVIAGHQARREILNARGALEGEGIATLGLILGYLQLLPIILVAGLVLVIGVIYLFFHIG